MGIKINNDDLKLLRKKMDNLRAFHSQRLANEVSKTGLEIVGIAKGQAPVDTGKLRQSIKAEKKGKSVEIVANANYAPYVEFGTGGNVTLDDMLELGIPASYAEQFKGAKEGNMRPQPFFFSAARIGFQNFLNRLKSDLNNSIK